MERIDSIVQFEAFLKRRFPGSRTARDYVSDVRQLERTCTKEWRDVTMSLEKKLDTKKPVLKGDFAAAPATAVRTRQA